MKVKLIMFWVSLCLITTSCRMSIVESHMSYGALTHLEEIPLLSAAPCSTIQICAADKNMEEFGLQAVKMWAHAIDRDEFLNFEIIPQVGPTCDGSLNRDKFFTTPQISLFPGEQLVDNEEFINKEAARFLFGKDEEKIKDNIETKRPFSIPAVGLIVYSKDKAELPVVVHEMGHLWGACDQYVAEDSNNCDDGITNHGNEYKVTQGSSMSEANRKMLSLDDIRAIRLVASREGVGANDEWKRFLKETDNGKLISTSEWKDKCKTFINNQE